jgi:hypothetical protein
MPLVPLAPFKAPRRAAAAQVAQLFNIPAPVGGLNYRDQIAAMSPNDALVLDNFIPKQSGVELRKGYQIHTDAINEPIGSVFAYNAADPDDNKIFAAADGDIYDCTTHPATALNLDTGSADNLWWTTQFSTGAANFLLAVSPSGGYWTYDTVGGWVERTPTNLPANPRTVGVWKRRVFFTCENDTNIYYMNAVNAITGTVTAFAMGAHLARGGYVSAVANWTLDAGVGIDDYLVVIGTEGDLMIWQGTDPSDATQFSLRGVWYVGPVPRYGRYFTPMGGDMMLVSEMGLVPLSRLINGQFVEGQPGPSAKIQEVLAPQIALLRGVMAWDVFALPSEDILILKLPPNAGIYRQYAMNITTGSWCTLSGLPMYCTTVLAGRLYFGTSPNGEVCKGFVGDLDGVLRNGAGGVAIEGDVQTAFQTFGMPGLNKKFDMARPIFVASSAPSVKVRLNTQYSFSNTGGSPAYLNQDPGFWDAGIWNLARWGGNANTYQAWVGLTGLGYYGSLRMRVRGRAGTVFTSAHILASPGGVM